MKCPFCGGKDLEVLESRSVDEDNSIRRRRQCVSCKRRFTTYERVKDKLLWVIKKDGRREPFIREKVRGGILRAIEKRPVSLELVEDIVSQVERDILKEEKEEISSRVIGRLVLRRLKKVDKVAWLRFASVYLEFEDLSDFEKAIEKEI
ncbi:MAG: transcriptional regulator NrdR [Patescibacteria group bacterium]|nr:MAG: transcriptional regulator NrdR [Patescibacteria group bacterium]